jgi:hypothetical protein
MLAVDSYETPEPKSPAAIRPDPPHEECMDQSDATVPQEQIDPNGNTEISSPVNDSVGEIPVPKGSYKLDYLDDPNFNPFQPVSVQSPKISARKTMTSADDDVPIVPKSSGGYNLDVLDDPNFNPFGAPPKDAPQSPTGARRSDAPVAASPAGVPISTNGPGVTTTTTDSGVYDELLGSGPPSSSAGPTNGAASDAESGASLTCSPQHLGSDAGFDNEDQAEAVSGKTSNLKSEVWIFVSKKEEKKK